jgi:predicted lipid-binding transport protein (Tim44 family)
MLYAQAYMHGYAKIFWINKLEDIVTPTIIILAMVAAFLGLRLYSVLGKRTGHEQDPLAGRMDRSIPETATGNGQQETDDQHNMGGDGNNVTAMSPGIERAAEQGLQRIAAADRSFDPVRFIIGGKAAYGMILEAFWSGNRDDLRSLTDDDVYDSFVEVIEQREARGETLDNRLVRIERAAIADAELQGKIARITMRFDADIASVVRDKDGELIAGSVSDAVETHDIWTFSRDLDSATPDWVLDETDQA